MRPFSSKVLLTITAVLFVSNAHGQNGYDKLKAMAEGPWHHLPNPVSSLQFDRDLAKCRVVVAQTPVTSSTPVLVETKLRMVLIDCLKASGYEPGAAPVGKPASDLSTLANIKYSNILCTDIAKMRASSPNATDTVFFIWIRGFIEGWNAGLETDGKKDVLRDEVFKVDTVAIPVDQQMKIVRKFCDDHPSKSYLGAAMELILKLKEAARQQVKP